MASAASIRPVAAALASSREPANASANTVACPGECVGVATACELGAAPFDRAFGLTRGDVRKAQQALGAERHFVAATADDHLAVVGVVDSRLNPSGRPALRRDHVEGRKPGVVDCTRGFDELFGPGDRLIIFDPNAEEPRVGGDGGGDVEVVVVGGPPERGAQIGQLGGEPGVRLTLSAGCPTGPGCQLRARRSGGHARPEPWLPLHARRVVPRRTGGSSPASKTECGPLIGR